MADREPPYDPYIPAGGAGAPGGSATPSGNQRTAALQAVSIASTPPVSI
jgi:vesicle-associated membrane protein 4